MLKVVSLKKVAFVVARKIAVILLAVFVFSFAAFCFLPEKTVYISGKVASPYYSGGTEGNKIAIMINVYENTSVVCGILDLFKEEGIKATFFVGGCWADDNAETLKRIADEGHLLANHGYFHKDHKKLSYEANVSEIKNCHELVKGITGFEMNLFAPPSGSFGTETMRATDKLGYKSIMWTLDTIDWRDDDEEKIIKRATEKVKAGDFVLIHPKKHTLSALDKILKIYKEKGLEPDTVARLI